MGCCCCPSREGYYGCATRGNKAVWCMLLISFVLGAALLAGGVAQGKDCFATYADCRREGNSHTFCHNFSNDKCNLDTYAALTALGAIFLGLVCPLLLLWFRCCGRRPEKQPEEELYPPIASFNTYPNSSSSRAPIVSAYPSSRKEVV